MKSRGTAAILALFLGGLGIHKFYLGQGVQGLLYLVFCWTLIPAFIALIECVVYLLMSPTEFDRRYNQAVGGGMGNQMGQNVTINLGSDHPLAGGGTRRNLTAELRELKELHVAGALTDQEFQVQKQRLLAE
jgi:TM2 domain-containing membrane protein YozV